MLVLGIESSCDETAAAIVEDSRIIRSNVVLSQTAAHSPYGGVVPEIAARSHIEHMDEVVQSALKQANIGWEDIDAIATTTGPGLIGGVIVGTMTGKTIASVLAKPFIAVNHLEGHALTVRLTHNIAFPYLLLLMSGGHSQLLWVKGVGQYERLGGTLDDAVGEAYDKTAKLLKLSFPGGPAVEEAALKGDVHKFSFPVPLKGRAGCDFSFSGLKTAVRLAAQAVLSTHNCLPEQEVADLCASFQFTVGEALKDRLHQAFCSVASRSEARSFVIAGGVAANAYLRKQLEDTAQAHGFTLIAPPSSLCTDNAAMIAWAGIEKLRLGMRDPLDTEPRARWPLY